MSNNQQPRRANDPEESRERAADPQQRDTDDEEADVERLLSDDVVADLCRLWSELVDGGEATDEEDEGEEEEGICEPRERRKRGVSGPCQVGSIRCETYMAYTPSMATMRP